ncbi:hypothetical protein F5883DRAFT_688703 [Diaporthe sp. PMI_573]|nr:hypothetical protein F5883DRAFT_688703 [Diaporthaceae sp. PMI_573]
MIDANIGRAVIGRIMTYLNPRYVELDLAHAETISDYEWSRDVEMERIEYRKKTREPLSDVRKRELNEELRNLDKELRPIDGHTWLTGFDKKHPDPYFNHVRIKGEKKPAPVTSMKAIREVWPSFPPEPPSADSDSEDEDIEGEDNEDDDNETERTCVDDSISWSPLQYVVRLLRVVP